MSDADSQNQARAVAESGRLDQFWAERLAGQGHTRTKIQQWIKQGLALVDGQVCRKPSFKLRGTENLSLDIPRACASPGAEQGDITVLAQDEHLLVLDKPPGLTVHPAPSCPEGTLVNRLLAHYPQLSEIDGARPGVVHRIDKDTSGLLLVALSEAVRLKLAQAFAKRQVRKVYLALVHGRPSQESGTINAPIGRDPAHKTRMAVLKGGRQAESAYQVVWSAPGNMASLVEVRIGTGRTHQIRVHMAHIGHPLLGDALYGPAQRAELRRARPLLAKLLSRQMLHAWKLGFTHPVLDVEQAYECPPPRDFWRVILALSLRVQRVGLVGLPGSGKSAVLKFMTEAGHPVWSADKVVAGLYEPGQDGWFLLRRRYGSRFTPDEGRAVDKKALLTAMLGSEHLRREVMEILYPVVLNRLREFWRENASARAGFAEVPMLLEAGWPGQDAVDLVVGVQCPEGVRRERLAAGRGWDQALMDAVDAWQWSWEKKLAGCALVVDNDGSLDDLGRAVGSVRQSLARVRREKVKSLLAWLAGRGYAKKVQAP